MIKRYSTRVPDLSSSQAFNHGFDKTTVHAYDKLLFSSIQKMTLSENFTFRSTQIIVHHIYFHCLLNGGIFSAQIYFYLSRNMILTITQLRSLCAFHTGAILRCEHFKFFQWP